jgi:hypothetical protein
MKKTKSQSWMQLLISGALVFMFTLSPFGSMPVYALDAPELLSPNNGEPTNPENYPPIAIPEFKWTAVEGATSYRLQVSGDIGFTTTAVNITTPNTSYTPTNATVFPDRIWYWRVRVEAPAPIGEYSSVWSFTKEWATETNKPTLIAPVDNAIIAFYDTIIFSWESVMGAAEYKLQIYSSPGGWATLDYSATTLATTHQPNAKLANGTYYWRVVPVDGGSHEGTPSEERSFVSAYNPVELALIEPENNVEPTFTPTLRWTAVRGAQYYRLQYSTDPSFSANLTQIDTRNSSYTPTTTLPNDVNYYWRVRVHSGDSISDWTPSWTFIKRWDIKPILLTPTNNYQHQRFPVFSWTPVPGASYYKVEISLYPGFSPIYDSGETANTFFSPNKYNGALNTYYWRVTPYDGSGKAGVPSNTFSYRSYNDSVAPSQVYPLFYYPPNPSMNPHEDRTAALPVFIWNRVSVPSGSPEQGNIFADTYRLQVSTDPTFASILWTVDTENTTATPTTGNPFTPLAETDYFWRVRPLVDGGESGEWSQIWKARFDLSMGFDPELIRPINGFEFAESTPLLEWFPISGATGYEVQISDDDTFSTIIDSASVSNPVYAPTNSLAQRSLGDVDFGIYYWRVRGLPDGVWSETRRFQIAAQSQWQFTRALGDPANRLQIGSDQSGDTDDPDYDLIDLQVAQASDSWYFGFATPVSPANNVTYALYLDIDHEVGSGGTVDAKGYTINTIPDYQPEHIVYVLQNGGTFSADQVHLYSWTGSTWDTVSILSAIGGELYQESGYVELKIPNTAIGYQDSTGSYAVSLVSLEANGAGLPKDSVPSDPSATSDGIISRFANVTERMNLAMPPNDAGVDPSTYPSVPPFFWDWPVLSPWSGAIITAYLDPLFTTVVESFNLSCSSYPTPITNYAQTAHAWSDDFLGDNTYYWRVRPCYWNGSERINYYGAWSQGWRFEREGFVPENLDTPVTYATPTFSWEMVEGAGYYDLQVDDDPSFGSTAININTRQNSYTPTTTLANGQYYWRVRVRRDGGVINDWTANQSFILNLPTPDGLTPESGSIVGRAPTLCWDPLVKASDSAPDIPVLAAWKYRVQVSKDPNFSAIFDTIDTEQSCWTPKKGFDDGAYYWRVAMIDGNAKLGNYSSPPQTFTKQYPITTLDSPESGSVITETPTFIWIPVDGAAKYKLEVSQYPTFSPTYESVTTSNTRYTPTKKYTTEKTYYWRVAIIDNDGKIGPFVGAIIIVDPNPYRIFLPSILR